MSRLIHEIWEEMDESGMVLHSCCLAGKMGSEARALLKPNARLVATFEAGCHFEAMTIYNERIGREKYTTNEDWDRHSYPESWLRIQRGESTR